MRRLGQHFLKNKNKIKKIIAALELKESDTIIEIGSGHGEVTNYLIKQYLKVIAIEKDKNLADTLKDRFSSSKNMEVIEGDALKIIENLKLKIENCKLVGNIPYYITGRLFRVLGELKKKPKIIVLTIQKEVAERICAQPPRMNLLAASVQFWADPKIIDFISKNDFRPRPKVDSAIVKLTTKNQQLKTKKQYYQLIKILFKQPRKTILNNLKSGIKLKNDELITKLSKLNVNPAARPQNLSLQQLKGLALEI